MKPWIPLAVAVLTFVVTRQAYSMKERRFIDGVASAAAELGIWTAIKVSKDEGVDFKDVPLGFIKMRCQKEIETLRPEIKWDWEASHPNS